LTEKVVIALNTAWNLVNFRSGLIRALVAAGYEVVAVAPNDKYSDGLKTLGCRFVPLHMDNGGTNPLKDVLLLWQFLRLFAIERPDVFLGYTVKPNVYGSLACRWLRIPVINNIAGLGAAFISGGMVMQIVRWLYRTALRRSAQIFFQNDDDRQLFVSGGLVTADKTALLPGSGIDLDRFVYTPMPATGNDCAKFRFLLVARMLRDKGVGEYVEAARLLRKHWPQVEFCLLGFLDVKNPAAISRAEMDAWVAEGVVNYLGESDDVRSQITAATCVVLPSYREGVPRSLLEAAAMGRPIITTDVVGCREVLDDGVNGLLCRPKDAADLAEKMARMIAMPQSELEAMGQRGRAKVEREFDEKIVIDKYLTAIKEVVKKNLLKCQ
jgi:glycosyltransferase involved in cell wall biosynthesis